MLHVRPIGPGLEVHEFEAAQRPDSAALERVAALWNAEKRRRGDGLFDGQVFSIARLDEPRIEGHFVPYSWFLAQLREPALHGVLKVRMLAVSGLLEIPEGIVFGRRSEAMTQDAGLWELVPSGGVSPTARSQNAMISLHHQLVQELGEEVGIACDRDEQAKPFVLVEDDETHVTDIGLHLSLDVGSEEVLARHRTLAEQEYGQLKIVPRKDLESFRHRHEGGLAPVSAALLDHAKALRETSATPHVKS